MKESKEIITIKDIARKFKCSPSTVSRALNDNPIINIETRKTLQEYAQRMGYQRNILSLSLLNKSTQTIGVVLPNISHFHETAMIEGLQSVFQPLNYLLNICITNESYQLEKEYIERLLANRVDGIFISVSQETYDNKRYEHLENVIKRKIPLIHIDRKFEGFASIGVVVNDYVGAFEATEHLIRIGCKRIAHLKGPRGMDISELRLNGYLDCLKKYNIEPDESLVLSTNFEIESAIEPTKRLLDLDNRPDGIFGVNDHVSIGAMNVIRQKNIEIPNEIAVIGFDNNPFAQYLCPSLSSVARQSKQIGLEASQLFLHHFKYSAENTSQSIVLSTNLIIRQSSQR